MRRCQAAMAAVLAGVTMLAGCQSQPAASASQLPILPIGGDFQLIDDGGQPFTLASQRGKVVLIFFGYSSCPDACPTTLSKLSTASRRLGEDRSKVKALYVSVDPERDTPQVLKDDLANFTLDATGLTGTKAEIDKVVQQYGAKYEIVLTPSSAAKYSISHTTSVFVLDAQGRVRKLLPYEASVGEVVTGIREVLDERS